MQWDEKELDIQFTPNVYMYFWTPNSEILAKALDGTCTVYLKLILSILDIKTHVTCHWKFENTCASFIFFVIVIRDKEWKGIVKQGACVYVCSSL